jgi:hypothetical protein
MGVDPWPGWTSASLSLLMICSTVGFFRAMMTSSLRIHI